MSIGVENGAIMRDMGQLLRSNTDVCCCGEEEQPQPCCFADESCLVVLPSLCIEGLGTPIGNPGDTCADVACPVVDCQPPTSVCPQTMGLSFDASGSGGAFVNGSGTFTKIGGGQSNAYSGLWSGTFGNDLGSQDVSGVATPLRCCAPGDFCNPSCNPLEVQWRVKVHWEFGGAYDIWFDRIRVAEEDCPAGNFPMCTNVGPGGSPIYDSGSLQAG